MGLAICKQVTRNPHLNIPITKERFHWLNNLSEEEGLRAGEQLKRRGRRGDQRAKRLLTWSRCVTAQRSHKPGPTVILKDVCVLLTLAHAQARHVLTSLAAHTQSTLSWLSSLMGCTCTLPCESGTHGRMASISIDDLHSVLLDLNCTHRIGVPNVGTSADTVTCHIPSCCVHHGTDSSGQGALWFPSTGVC